MKLTLQTIIYLLTLISFINTQICPPNLGNATSYSVIIGSGNL